jgi:drug/metabolite transporter (DMT)-like permease
LFAAMCVIWGVPYLLIRVAVRDIDPATLVLLRTGIGGLILLPLALGRGGFGPVLARWRPLLAFAAIEIAAPWLLLGDAERHLSSSLSGLLIAAVPLVGVLVARVVGDADGMDAARAIGLLLGIAGVGMLVGLDLGELNAGALAEVAVVVVGYAVAPVIMARHLADLPSIPVVSASLLLVALGYLPYGLARWPSTVSAEALGSVVVLGVVCTALAFVLFFALIRVIGPARSTVITYVNPAVAVLLGVLLLGERFTLGMAVGFPLILLGSVLAARRRPVAPSIQPGQPGQSMRTEPSAVSNTAATTPLSSVSGDSQSTEIPSSGCAAAVPR